jgi:hypothetical protein
MVAVGRLFTMTVATGADSTGLGRWAWMHMGEEARKQHAFLWHIAPVNHTVIQGETPYGINISTILRLKGIHRVRSRTFMMT